MATCSLLRIRFSVLLETLKLLRGGTFYVRSSGNILERELHFSWWRYHIFTFFARGVAASVKEMQHSIGDTCIYSRYISFYRVCPRKNDISLVSFSLFLSLSLSISSFFSRSFVPSFRFDVVIKNPLMQKYLNRNSFFFIKRINFFSYKLLVVIKN